MPYERFTEWEPKGQNTKCLLGNSIQILDEYAGLGYAMTLRQLYYQLVSRGLIPNEQRYYKRLGEVITKAREGGFIDWNAIVDRGRNPVMASHWKDGGALLQAAAQQFRLDRWADQPNYVEIWCEKDALSSVLEPICDRYHIMFMANRGYSSATAMWQAAQRVQAAENRGQQPVVIYLGDHDPSGMDMTRDVQDRLDLLSYGAPIRTIRLALNFDQVEAYNPPPNPTKLTDSRAVTYIQSFGNESWELDALDPQTLDQMVSDQIDGLLDQDLYDQHLLREEEIKARLEEIAQQMSEEEGA